MQRAVNSCNTNKQTSKHEQTSKQEEQQRFATATAQLKRFGPGDCAAGLEGAQVKINYRLSPRISGIRCGLEALVAKSIFVTFVVTFFVSF
jgi:hypothetical protein